MVQVTYFSAFGRLATVQCVFWGNPVTSGQPTVDYFISGARLEPVFAPNTPGAHGALGYGSAVAAHYSEQVLLLGDQGIWYAPIAPPRAGAAASRARRETYGLPPAPRDGGSADGGGADADASPTILACLGSVFKLHPDYDRVLHRILVAAPNAHLALLTGRREAWTARVRERLRSVLEAAPPGSAAYVNATERVHFLPRQRGETAFVEMIAAVADVVLHPFPFGGSKTAADALAAGRPFVAIHGAALRGHMAVALLASLELVTCPTCAARGEEEYVRTAVALARRPRLRAAVAAEVAEKRHVLWSRREVISEWERFFLRAASAASVGAQPRRFPRVSALRRIAVRAERAGNVARAERALRRLLLLLPRAQRGPIYSDLGAVLQQAGRLDEAERATRTALSLLPPAPILYNNLGVILRALERWPEALRAYRAGLELVRQRSEGGGRGDEAARGGGKARAALHDKLAMNAANLLKDAGRFAEGAAELVAALPRALGVRLAPPGVLLSFGEAAILLALHDLDPSGGGAGEGGLGDGAIRALGALLPPRAGEGDRATHSSAPAQRLPLDVVVRRLRGDFRDSTNALAVISAAAGRRWGAKFVALRALLDGAAPRAAAAATRPPPAAVHLVVQHFAAASAARQREVDDVLCVNLLNQRVATVHLLLEGARGAEIRCDDGAAAAAAAAVKLVQVSIGARLTFKRALEYAAAAIPHGDVVVLANADIALPAASALRLAHAPALARGDVFALLRWEAGGGADDARRSSGSAFELSPRWVPRIDQQDAWAFAAPLALPTAALERLDFPLGTLRCDNRFAHVLREAGHRVTNPSREIVTLHHHSGEGKGWTNGGAVRGAGDFVLLAWPRLPEAEVGGRDVQVGTSA